MQEYGIERSNNVLFLKLAKRGKKKQTETNDKFKRMNSIMTNRKRRMTFHCPQLQSQAAFTDSVCIRVKTLIVCRHFPHFKIFGFPGRFPQNKSQQNQHPRTFFSVAYTRLLVTWSVRPLVSTSVSQSVGKSVRRSVRRSVRHAVEIFAGKLSKPHLCLCLTISD